MYLHRQIPMSSGVGWKISGASILAIYWILAFLSSIMLAHVVEPSDLETSANTPVDMDEETEVGLIDILMSYTFIHAAGFTLILIGFIVESSDTVKSEIGKRKQEKKEKMLVELNKTLIENE